MCILLVRTPPTDINSHRDSIEEMKTKSEAIKNKATEALEIFNTFYLRNYGLDDEGVAIVGLTSKVADVKDTPDVQTKYNTPAIHTIS